MALTLRALVLPAWLLLALAAVGVVDDAARANAQEKSAEQRMSTMKISLTIDGKAVTATLIDNATTRDLVSLLPMTLTLDDYADTEKISYLPRKLSTAGAPNGTDPSMGDIAYYAPWGNLAIFFRDAGFARGLIKLGRLDSGIEALSAPGELKATIQPVEGRGTAP